MESQIHVSFSSTEMHSTVSRVCVLHLISLLAQGVNLWNAKYRVCLTCNLFVFLVMCNLLKSENPEISVKVNTVVDSPHSLAPALPGAAARIRIGALPPLSLL